MKRIPVDVLFCLCCFFVGCIAEETDDNLVGSNPNGSQRSNDQIPGTGPLSQPQLTGNQPGEGVNDKTNAPQLKLNPFGNEETSASIDFEDIPDQLIDRHNSTGVIRELDSFADLFQYNAGAQIAELADWQDFETVPIKMRFDVLRNPYIGELNMMVANSSEYPIIATVEPVIGGKPLASISLTDNGLMTTTIEAIDSIDPTFGFDFKIPSGIIEPLAVLMFVCLDSNANGKCSDERVMNLNYYINQVDPQLIEEAEVQSELRQVVKREMTGYYLAGEKPKGVVYYAYRAILDPLKKNLFSFTDFFTAKNVKTFKETPTKRFSLPLPGLKMFAQAEEIEVDNAIEETLAFVDEMLRSETAEFGLAYEEIPGEPSEIVPIKVGFPLIKYQVAVNTVESDFIDPAYNVTEVIEAISSAPLLSDDERAFLANIAAEALEAAESIVPCGEAGVCQPSGVIQWLTHDQTPAGLYDHISYCNACTCTQPLGVPTINCTESIMAYAAPVIPQATEELKCNEACLCMPDGKTTCAQTPAGHYNKTDRCLGNGGCTCDSPGYEQEVTCPDVKAYEEAKMPPTGETASRCSQACLCAPNGAIICSAPPRGFEDKTAACKTNCTCVDPGKDSAISCEDDPHAYEVVPIPPVENTDGVIHCSQVCTCTVDNRKICTPVIGKESLISRCDSDCACKAPGQSGLVCDRDPRVNGCFVEGTSLLDSTGKDIPVESLKKDDFVLDYKREKRRIEKVVYGPEAKKVIYITTEDGRTIGVSDKHPVMTMRGLKLARELTPDDALVTATGEYASIARLERKEYEKNVYNFVLESKTDTISDHLLISGGLVTGDLKLQNKLTRERIPQIFAKRTVK